MFTMNNNYCIEMEIAYTDSIPVLVLMIDYDITLD